MKTLTKVLAGVVAGAAALAQTDWASGLLSAHPKAAAITGGILGIAALFFNPKPAGS